jgi:putative nucleotidyltransferase with HDIG domain
MFSSGKKPSRLGQWTGRRRSSRGDELILPTLWQPHVWCRLGVVFATVVAATLLACWWGPPAPYRLGEVRRGDLRARVYFEVVNWQQTEQKRDEAVDDLPPDERQDPLACEKARLAEPPVMEKYPAGTPLVQGGQPISEQQLFLLQEEHRAYKHSLSFRDRVRLGAAQFLVMGLLAGLVVLYVVRFQSALAQSLTKSSAICLLAIGSLALALLLSQSPWHATLVPLTVTALVLTMAYNPPFALLMALSLSLATTVALGQDLNHLLVQMGGLATAVLMLRSVRTRTRLVEVGMVAGLAFLVMTFATDLLAGQTARFILLNASRHFACGALAGFLMSGGLPLIEKSFNIVTDVRLLELADGSHPLLQELLLRAPGTYTHSMTVGTLSEAAAEAIEANPLLARVGSYFHDVGKMLKAQYFIENQTGENRHDELEPALSTLIIIGHVKDGLALAKQYRLPRPILDVIAQHHGTTLVEYFYREAVRQQAECGQESPLNQLEAAFRYPGPKPQNRENAIVMLADAVESSSRALTDPTPGSLRKLVHDLLMKRLLDGQFEECGLTLSELHVIEKSLSKGLIALFHGRIKYPEVKERGMAS